MAKKKISGKAALLTKVCGKGHGSLTKKGHNVGKKRHGK